MKSLRFLFFLIPFFCIIPLFPDEMSLAYYVIAITSIHTLCFLKLAFKNKNNLFSPPSLFVSIYNMYFILGVVMWIIRETYFENWEGDFYTVITVYAITSYILSFWGSLELYRRPTTEPILNLKQLNLSPLFFIVLLCLEYFGIYLFTAGFSVIPIFETNIDEARKELSTASAGAGAGIGAILIYCGVLCIFHVLACKQRKIIKTPLFIVSYIPFVLYGGRLLMLLPLLVVPIIYMVKKNIKISKKNILAFTVTILCVFTILMLYGTFRGKGEIDMELFYNFLTADLFPEFRGSVAAYKLNSKDLSFDYLSMVFSNLFPGGIASILGIDKEHQLQTGAYVASLFGYENLLGIRISLTGELLLCNLGFYFIFWSILIISVHKLNVFYFNKHIWGRDKFISLYIGLFVSLVIPYGTGLIANTIIIVIFFCLLKNVVYSTSQKRTKGFIL